MSATSREPVSRYPVRVCLVLLTVLGLLGGTALGASATARMSAGEIVRSSVLLLISDCPAASDPRSDDPDDIADLADGRCNLLGNGSGTIIDPSGLILTNAHVVLAGGTDPNDALWLMVGMTGDARELPTFDYFARPIAVDPDLDLALVQIAYDGDGRDVDPDDLDLPALPLAAHTADLDLEDPLRLIGYPGVGGITVTVVESRVAGFHFDLEHEEWGNTAWIKTNPAAGAGVSGGTAVNEAGELVGVPTAGFGTELRCQDLNGDGLNDPATECQAMTGEVQMVRPIEFVHAFLEGAQGAAGAEETERARQGGLRDPHRDAVEDDRERRDAGGLGGEIVTVEVEAELIDAETGEALAGSFLIVLQLGVTCATFDVEAAVAGDVSQLLSAGMADRDGVAVAEPEVEVGEGYSLIAAAEGYLPLCGDDFVLAEDGDTAIFDLGTVALEAA